MPVLMHSLGHVHAGSAAATAVLAILLLGAAFLAAAWLWGRRSDTAKAHWGRLRRRGWCLIALALVLLGLYCFVVVRRDANNTTVPGAALAQALGLHASLNAVSAG